MPDLIRHPACNTLKTNWIPGQARNDKKMNMRSLDNCDTVWEAGVQGPLHFLDSRLRGNDIRLLSGLVSYTISNLKKFLRTLTSHIDSVCSVFILLISFQ